MRCPYCGCEDDRVLESRPARDGEAIRRRRECLECGRRYTTFEQVEQRPIYVVKKDGRREPFDLEKLVASMAIACRKRPIPTALIRSAAEEIERQLVELPDSEVHSVQLGEMVLDALGEIDPVAYVRFASVYHEFDDPEEFQAWVARMKSRQQQVSRHRRRGGGDD
ncbi:MAG: transcriptional repressor NrdR [Armatimonadetes bacterium]|nr:MAG: transcriptional repressor NrdR [Armatimonadota bacterium]GIV01637.1 MAG: transcriptional repressor NrdR [Fimbriimonadales bacterium]